MLKPLALIILALCFTGSSRAQQYPEQMVAAGQREAPLSPIYIKLKALDGKVYDVKDYRGNVVVVAFGETWCEPCVAELEAMRPLIEEYSARPVKFFWVSLDRRDETSDRELKTFVKSLKLSIPVLRDPTGLTYAQFSQNQRVPLLVLFGSNGELAMPLHFGMSQATEYQKLLRSRISELLNITDKETSQKPGS